MRSFGAISLIASLAFSMFASAAPAPAPLVPSVHDVSARDVVSLPCIIDDLQAAISVHICTLEHLTVANATVDIVTTEVTAIVVAVQAATTQVLALKGCLLDDILAKVDGTICTIAEIATIVFGVLSIILTVVAKVVVIVKADLSAILTSLDGCLCDFISAVLSIVTGLLAALVAQVWALLPCFQVLNLVQLCAALQLNISL